MNFWPCGRISSAASSSGSAASIHVRRCLAPGPNERPRTITIAQPSHGPRDTDASSPTSGISTNAIPSSLVIWLLAGRCIPGAAAVREKLGVSASSQAIATIDVKPSAMACPMVA